LTDSSFSSPDYQQARLLQLERYSRACKPGKDTYQKYLEIVDAASQDTIPLVVRRHGLPLTDSLVGTARLELPPATTIEAIMRFQPDSLAAAVLARRTFAEVGVFATRSDLPWSEVLDIMDTVAYAVVQLARKQHIEYLWIFPRLSMMSLLLAEIPSLLPPYHFALCTDVAGWNETSSTLQKIRALGMKGLPVSPETLPVVIQISPEQWAADLKERLALQEQRRQHPDLPRLLQTAMRQSYQQMEEQRVRLSTQTGKEKMMQKPGKKETELAPGILTAQEAPVEVHASPVVPPVQEERRFLPFVTSGQDEATYLRQVVEQGGEAATNYKKLSYELLQLKPGMQVLDVGCGIGVDLPALAEGVGADGLVVGLDHDQSRLRTAKEANAGRSNVRLVMAEAQELPFPNRSFDGVRADRVLQYIPESAQTLTEMVRVLRPGGVLTLIEPDWRSIALFPASPAGGDDDQTWSAVVQLCQRRLPHALIGRQLAALLQQQGEGVWDEVRTRVIAYTFSSWQVTNVLLQVSQLAQALIEEEPGRAEEVNAWLLAMEKAALRGEFLAGVPLFFAYARKAENK
jgi:ubiquinone/menaquinone biosynthesis C-methylase UbiE